MAAVAAAAVSAAGPAGASGFRAEIVRTAYGVPHVSAPDFAGLGYGAAYAYAQDNLCILAGELITVRGDRARTFGSEGETTVSFNPARNLESDLFFRSAFDLPALRRGFTRTSPDYQALMRGWVAGYNRYLRDTPPERRPAACRGTWVVPMTMDDAILMGQYRARFMSSAFLAPFIVNAQPPSNPGQSKPLASAALHPQAEDFGSNGWAFGRDVTANGSGLLLGNPHVPWSGGIRFYEVHLTVPGRFEVMGVINAGGPMVTMGFNRDVAWTHTISNDRHFVFTELALDPLDPTAYLVDGKRIAMRRQTVRVEGLPGAPPHTRTLYSTIYGPVIVSPATPWNAQHAYAISDSNAGNQREGDTWLGMGRARSVRELQAAMQRTVGLAWSNTMAADRHGEALFADITSAPNVSAEKLKACAPKGVPQGLAGFFYLDGSRSACGWDAAPGAPEPGLMPGAAMPSLVRTDFVQNANDSYWLTNPAVDLGTYSPILGRLGVAQGLRTRAALETIASRLSGADGLGGRQLDADRLKAMLFADRAFAADLVLDDLLTACATADRADLVEPCRVLRLWDRRMDADAVGGMLFTEFWNRAAPIPGVWRIAFDGKDPVHTPRGLAMSGPAGPKVLDALADAAAAMRKQGLALDAPLRDQQFVPAQGERIPIHGGDSGIGVLNAIRSRASAAERGYVPWTGSSFIQVVTFDAAGPVADAVLSHSQSSDPASPHAFDQTRLYSAKRWVRLPFLPADVAREAEGPALRLRE